MPYAADLLLKTKILPRTLRSTLPIASATEMQITTVSRAWKPLPPGNVQLNAQPYATWPATTTGDVTLSWSHRNRITQGQSLPLVAQDVVGAYAIEGTLTIEVLIAGLVKRTWTGVTGPAQVYTLAQRTADDAVLSKAVQFRITPINGTYTGTVRTTPSFVMG
jgi:hypothetical protein